VQDPAWRWKHGLTCMVFQRPAPTGHRTAVTGLYGLHRFWVDVLGGTSRVAPHVPVFGRRAGVCSGSWTRTNDLPVMSGVR
jgi:hypothetical protein